MDEVDIDNVEDLNELEARLYAQIHHEPTVREDRANDDSLFFNANEDKNEDFAADSELSLKTNKNLSKRYWASTDKDVIQRRQEQPQCNQHLLIRNPFKIPNQENHPKINQQLAKQTESLPNKVLNPFKGNKKSNSVQNNNPENTSTAETNSLRKVAPSAAVNNGNKKNRNVSTNYPNAEQTQSTEESDLKLNPIADWVKRKKNPINKKSNQRSSSINIKQGLFSRQQLRLEKARRLDEKKKKSKKAKNSAAVMADKLNPTEIIDLDSANESDSSDVIVIPTAPLPTFTVDDSADEDETDKVNITMEHEENAVDSTDVQLSSTSTSFIKPKEILTQSIIVADTDEKRLDNSSRCTSPCSIQSSDDFIRNIDHVRLLAGGRGMADDEDLVELTSDRNILVEFSDISKQIDNDIDNVCMENIENPLNCNQQNSQEANLETSDTLEFATPNTKKTQSRDYRVDQSQFKALDVYESESDITDSVYSKGVGKSTVIRQIDSSSDDVEDISTCSQKTKRLRKRRTSSSNKESDPNNENLSSSDDDNIDDDNKVLRTPVPYIAKGPAVERYKPQKRNRTLSFGSYAHKNKLPKIIGAGDNISDTEFLTTLNNLAQGQGDVQEIQNLDESEESETENVPTAREMAEKILSQNSKKAKVNELFTDDMALPKDILNDLDKVFETIDQLDRDNSTSVTPIDNSVNISDSSDSDREKHFIYPSVPNEDAQIIKYFPNKSSAKTHDENGSPIYNVIYSRGIRKPGGIGWNDEMRKFYNDSWNGEHFILSKVLQKMNPEKNLWKIYTEDRFNIRSNKRSTLKCTNCCEFGHKRAKCKSPRKPLLCYMCGESGHYEPRCPNTICLRCGNKTQVFTKSCNACSYQNRLTCLICKIRGHSVDYCPDKWRRYHSTTEANVHPNNNVDYNPRKYCCVCGARGHISDFCRSALRFLEYPAISSSIKSHQKSYNDVVVRTPYNGIAVNLMYEPCQEYKLNLIEQTSLDKYYGRFLRAVGLEFLLRRRRYASTIPPEMSESSAKRTKRLSKIYEANPYLKVSLTDRKNNESVENAPNQVPEVTESGSVDQYSDENRPEEEEVIIIADKSEDVVEVTESDEEEVICNIQLNTNEKHDVMESNDENFISPKDVTIVATEITTKSQMEPSVILDSDSNYSFSDHFDVAALSSGNDVIITATKDPINLESQNQKLQNQEIDKTYLTTAISRPKAREMEALPDFIPLVDSTVDQNEQSNVVTNFNTGISGRFVAAESDDEDMEEPRRNLSPLPELPCEAKIYLTHSHTKYLLSPHGNAFLVKTSRTHKLRARLDFTSIGHVLVIFGLPSNQDKFQRELLMKYRDLEDEISQKQFQSSINVPKRTFVLIKFLRENIIQLMNNLGNVNQLLHRLQFLERQKTKSCLKTAEKVRRSLNMILVGQAGLKNGTMHLDKLLMSLKTLINDVNGDVAPPQLRSEITDHWKVIFSAYRHDNYRKLVETYNKLVSKNLLPQLNIDPILLGQKVLDTSFSEEQKQRLEQPRVLGSTSAELSKQNLPNYGSQKNAKNSKSKPNTEMVNISKPSTSNTESNVNKTKPTILKEENIKRKSNSISTSTLQNTTKSYVDASSTTSAKTKVSNATILIPNKVQQSSSPNSTSASAIIDESSKKQTQNQTGPLQFLNSQKHSTVSTTIKNMTDNRKNTCDTLLAEISSGKPNDKNLSRIRDSMKPSAFWSREAIRYLDECILLSVAHPEFVEKLKRIQNKSKNGQLSYNDYLAAIKLHTTLNGK